jgi:hypothetical protein
MAASTEFFCSLAISRKGRGGRGVYGQAARPRAGCSPELQGVRDMLRSEGERVCREIAGYASLNHASMNAMKVIGDSLKQRKEAPVNRNSVPAHRS